MIDFYQFRSKLANHNVVQVRPIQDMDELKLIKGDYQGVFFPVEFKQEYGKYFYDILYTGYAGFYLISEKLQHILEINQLSGWQPFPIKLYDEKNNLINGYCGFSVTGHCGPLSYDKCEIIEKRQVPEGPLAKYYRGVTIEQWDGADFFTPQGTYQTFVTLKAGKVLQANKITNLELEKLENIETNLRHVKRNA